MRDVPAEHLVDLATATLVAALRAAHNVDHDCGLSPATIDLLVR